MNNQTLQSLDTARGGTLLEARSRNGTEGPLARIMSEIPGYDLSDLVCKSHAMAAHGGFSDVYVGTIPYQQLSRHPMSMTDGIVKVAVKRLRVPLEKDDKFAKTLAREMGVWSHLDHPNILPFLGYMFEGYFVCLVSEWMDCGTVTDYWNDPKYDVIELARGIAQGLEYIHNQNIIHSDIKADNILISPCGNPLICDFGISRMLDSSQNRYVSTTHDGREKGSIRWMAQELFYEPRHTKETDVWAFAMTLYEMASRQVPYSQHKKDVYVLTAVMRGELPNLRDLDASLFMDLHSQSLIRSICASCWAKDSKERPTMTQIVQLLAPTRQHEPSPQIQSHHPRNSATQSLMNANRESPTSTAVDASTNEVAAETLDSAKFSSGSRKRFRFKDPAEEDDRVLSSDNDDGDGRLPTKRSKIAWEDMPDTEPSKRQVEAGSMKTIDEVVKFYDDAARMPELADKSSPPLELLETVVPLLKTRIAHGTVIPDETSDTQEEREGQSDADSDGLSLSFWGAIDGGESSYFNDPLWEWDSANRSGGGSPRSRTDLS